MIDSDIIPHKDYKGEIKIVFVGNSGVGKTSIINRYINDTFREKEQMTCGVMYFSRTVETRGVAYKLNIWDTAGQERFKAVTGIYFKDAQGVIIVGDLSDDNNYMDSIKKWYEEIKEKGDKDCVMVMVGNKSDMIEDED